MDTGTHIAMGLGLAGLAHLDPAVTVQPEMTAALTIGVILGSNAPDADTALRLKDNSLYIRHHRGFSHALPMIVIWPLIICGGISLFFTGINLLHLWLWTLLSVFLHVFADLFNTYGTQMLRPFSKKWISWNVIPIFDPFIFTLHLVGCILWVVTPFSPGRIFAGVYAVLILYYVWRTAVHRRLEHAIRRTYPGGKRYTVIPTVKWTTWHVVAEWERAVRIGEFKRGQLTWTERLTVNAKHHPAVKAAERDMKIRRFLYFTDYAYPELKRTTDGYEVRWVDVRYHHKKNFPFIAVVLLDRHLRPIDSYAGWANEKNLQKKMNRSLIHFNK